MLRKASDEEVAAAVGRARGCAAAVAAEAAFVDGDRGAALEFLDVVAAELPELASSVTPHRALLAAELGRVDVATALLAAVPERAVQWRARIELALARAAHDGVKELALLDKQASRDPAALEALCARGRGDRCVDLVLRFAGHPLARAHEDAVDVAHLSIDAIDSRLKALLAAARPRRAVDEGRRWLAAHRDSLDAPDSLHAGVGRVKADVGQALLRLHKETEALEVTTWRFKRAGPGPPDLDVESARVHAKALTRLGRFADASAVWSELERLVDVGVDAYPDVAEAHFFAAFSLIEGNDVDGALKILDSQPGLMDRTPWLVQASWQRGFLNLTAKGDADTALFFFDELVALKDKELRKHRYWRGRALAALKRDDEAKREWQGLVGEDPLDWYGQLARRDLGLKPLTGKAIAADALARAVDGSDADVGVARLLFSLGFDDEARDLCRSKALAQPSTDLTTTTKAPTKKTQEKRPELKDIGLCQSVDDANFGWRRGGLYVPQPMTQKNRLTPSSSWRVSYAMPWLPIVDAAAVTAKIPRSFVYGIMRTESGFDANAVSVAGARGALQLLPSVARKVGSVAPHSGSGDVDDDIQLGAGLLGLLRAEHGSLLMAAAAYNGAPEFAQDWAKRFAGMPVDIFVERVPFKETRDYIKRVLAVEAVYRGLDGGEASLDLPATIAPATTTVTLFPYDE